MTKEQMVLVAAILTTLAEVDGCPESTLYLTVGCDWVKFETIKGILVSAGLINCRGHYVTLTEKCKEIATKLNETLAASK